MFPMLPVDLIHEQLEWDGIGVNFPYSLEQQKMLWESLTLWWY